MPHLRTPSQQARALASLLAPSLLLACSCSDEPAAGGTTASTGAGGAGGVVTTTAGLGAGTTSATGGAGGDAGSGGVPLPGPCPGYDGWETWDEFASDGHFCVPASEALLPEPITWEPCDAIVGLPVGCQQMVHTWPTDPSQAIGGAVSGWVETDGRVHLSFNRNLSAGTETNRMHVVAEADGPVRSAMLDLNGDSNPGWALWSPSESAGVRQGKLIFYIQQEGSPGDLAYAAVGGDVGVLYPPVLHSWRGATTSMSMGVSSDFWVARSTSQVHVAAWGEPLELVHTAGQGDGGQLVAFYPFGDMLFWRDQPYPSASLWAYKLGGPGAYPLVAHDPTKNVSGFGTDGTHMVWVVSHDVKSTYVETPFEDSTRDIMVSPYAETAAGLTPVRLRSYPSIYPLIQRFTVGCGYAGHKGGETGKGLLVRLADGYSWPLPAAGCTPPNVIGDFCIADVLAITCEEMFVRVEGKANLARISIDALGPSAPPD